MTDRPIIFSAPMIRALLDGRKTMTRRVLKDQPGDLDRPFMMDDGSWHVADSQGCHMSPLDVRWRRGDRLWVRETYYQFGHWEPVDTKRTRTGRLKWCFVADRPDVLFEPPEGEPVRLGRHHRDPATPAWHKRLARFMPRAFSRLTLIVENVRVERLQEISEADAIAEGIKRNHHGNGDQWCDYPLGSSAAGWTDPRDSFESLWRSLHGPDAWAANPWVCAISFRTINANIDTAGAS